MFGDLFGGLFGGAQTKPVGTVVEQDDKFYLLMLKLDSFVGCYAAVEAEGPEDRLAHLKPLVLFIYGKDLATHKCKQARTGIANQQLELLKAARGAQPEVEVANSYPKAPPKKMSAWDVSMPGYTKKNWSCLQSNPKCPGQHAASFGSLSTFTSDSEFLDTLCEHHRPMVESYLAENPNAWSETPDPVDPDAEEPEP